MLVSVPLVASVILVSSNAGQFSAGSASDSSTKSDNVVNTAAFASGINSGNSVIKCWSVFRL